MKIRIHLNTGALVTRYKIERCGNNSSTNI